MKKRLSLSLSLARSRKKKERGARSMCLSALCVLRSCEKFEDPHADESKIRLDISKKGREMLRCMAAVKTTFFSFCKILKVMARLLARTHAHSFERSLSLFSARAHAYTRAYI